VFPPLLPLPRIPLLLFSLVSLLSLPLFRTGLPNARDTFSFAELIAICAGAKLFRCAPPPLSPRYKVISPFFRQKSTPLPSSCLSLAVRFEDRFGVTSIWFSLPQSQVFFSSSTSATSPPASNDRPIEHLLESPFSSNSRCSEVP